MKGEYYHCWRPKGRRMWGRGLCVIS
uniref:Uncharacterized protein n=1 Tax=Anguilla anguilla TaxID=7936 RepID=A0A0E9PDH4_ANGAN